MPICFHLMQLTACNFNINKLSEFILKHDYSDYTVRIISLYLHLYNICVWQTNYHCQGKRDATFQLHAICSKYQTKNMQKIQMVVSFSAIYKKKISCSEWIR